MRVVVVFLFSIVVGLNYLLWYDDTTGLMQLQSTKARLEAQQQENARLAERNHRLEAEVKSLRDDLDAVEERARSEMGLIRRDETFYHILQPKPSAAEQTVRNK